MTKLRQELEALLARRNQLNAEIEAVQTTLRRDALENCVAAITEYGFTEFELGLRKVKEIPAGRRGSATFKPKAARAPLPALYQDPESGATWSGRGKAPKWIAEGDRDSFLIRTH